MPTWQILVCGAFGGALPDLIRISTERFQKRPLYLAEPFFWLGFLILVVLGCAAAYILQAQTIKEAVTIGFAAPELFSRLGAAAIAAKTKTERLDQPPSGGKGATVLNRMSWWWNR